MATVKLKPSRKSFLLNYFLTLVIVAFYFFVSAKQKVGIEITALVAIISFFFLLEPEIQRFMIDYLLEDDQIVEVKGLITKKKTFIPYHTVSRVHLSKGIIGRILNYGTIIVTSSAGMEGSISMKGIHNPEKYLKYIQKKIGYHG